MKKLYALLLVIAMLATAFVACNGDDEKSEAPSDASTDAASNTSTEASEPEEDKCWLPEKNWNTTILWASLDNKDSESDVKNFEIWCEEDIGDTLSKTVVERSNWLRDTYGITIDLIKGPDGGTVDYARLILISMLSRQVRIASQLSS